jgi:hypothetical protein
LCAIGSGALAQTVVTIPAFDNRFAGIHQPVVALNTINPPPTRPFGGSTWISDPAARGVVTSPTAAATRTTLDPTVMNVPVFPGNTAILMQQGAFNFTPFGIGAFPGNVGFPGNSGFFMQQGTGQSLVEVDPFRTTATPGPAVNAVPNPAAPVPTTPQIQPTTGTTIPVQQQNPPMPVPVVPGTVVPGTPQPIQPQGVTPGPIAPNR